MGTSCLITLVEFLEEVMMCVNVVCIDFRKAFDKNPKCKNPWDSGQYGKLITKFVQWKEAVEDWACKCDWGQWRALTGSRAH